MIIIPAILVAIIEAAMIGGLAGAVICGMEDKRTLDNDADKSLRTAHICAAQGAVFGGAFGAAGVIVGPVIGGVGSMTDDLAMPAFHSIDDLSRTGAGAIDDVARPGMQGMRLVRMRFAKNINAPINYEANVSRASYFKSLRVAKNANPKGGFVYVAEVKGVTNTKLYKIGYTKRPPQRIKEIQSTLNKTVGGKANFTCIMRTQNVFQLESALHASFWTERLRNFAAGTEFFHLNPAQLAAACSF